tara:strand:- start:11853 stop:12575 length:723 start_codon:yes stop_codon:yes gene_type:complete
LRSYKVNRVLHTVYDSVDEVPGNITIVKNWRNGTIGDWVLTDDECVIQVIRKGSMLQKNKEVTYLGTCTGTFIINKKTIMDADRRANIYSFGGNKTPEEIVASRRELTANEELFVQYVAAGIQPQDAYVKAFPTNNKQYARMKAVNLIKTERVKTAMKEELKPVLEELGINETTVLENINNIAQSSEKDETRLKALFKLSDIMDLEDKNTAKVQQITGVQFQGFDDKMIDVAERPKKLNG